MTEGGATTTYTYDDWGRTVSKSDGTHAAADGWRFGHNLRTGPPRCQAYQPPARLLLGNAHALEACLHLAGKDVNKEDLVHRRYQ
jgi:hypothetical protein